MQYNASGEPQIRVHVDGISLEGDVIVERVRLWDGTNDLFFDSTVNDGEASPTVVLPTENHNMVFNGSTWDRMRGNIADGVLTQISNDYLAISKDTNANSDSNRIFVNATGTVELGATTLSALETITVNQGTNPWTVTGNVNATISGDVSVAENFKDVDAYVDDFKEKLMNKDGSAAAWATPKMLQVTKKLK